MLYLKAVRCYNEEKLIRKGKFFMKISDYATGLQHLGIPTKDMAETLLFYSELGFEIAHATKNEATGQAVGTARRWPPPFSPWRASSRMPGSICGCALPESGRRRPRIGSSARRVESRLFDALPAFFVRSRAYTRAPARRGSAGSISAARNF